MERKVLRWMNFYFLEFSMPIRVVKWARNTQKTELCYLRNFVFFAIAIRNFAIIAIFAIHFTTLDQAMEIAFDNFLTNFNELADKLAALSETVDQNDQVLHSLINNLNSQIAQLQSDLLGLEGHVDSEDAVLQAAINSVRASLIQLEADIQAVADRTTSLESSIAQINADLNAITIKIGQLEIADTELNAKIESLEQGLQALAEYVDLNDDQLQAMIDDLQRQIDDLKTELDRFERESDQVDAQLQAEIDILESD